MWIKYIISTIIGLCTFSSCSLQKPTIIQYEPIESYKYVYVPATKELSSSTGVAYSYGYGLSAYNVKKSINPRDVIIGYLIKQGFIIIPDIRPEIAKNTLIVNYGESGRRSLNLGYTIEITLQFISAYNNNVICQCTAEGQGDTEADDIREAITRALDGLFKNN